MTPDTFALLAAFLCLLAVALAWWGYLRPARSTERPQRGPWAGSGAKSAPSGHDEPTPALRAAFARYLDTVTDDPRLTPRDTETRHE